MCEPTTILLGTTLAVSAAGTYLQYKAQKEGQEAQNKAAEYNAQIQERQAANYEEQAKDIERNMTADESRLRTQVGQVRGAQRAGFAGSGVTVGEGSARDVERDTQKAGEFDAMTLKANAAREAYALRTQNKDAIEQARLTRMSKNTSNLGPNATLLSGAANIGSTYLSYRRK